MIPPGKNSLNVLFVLKFILPFFVDSTFIGDKTVPFGSSCGRATDRTAFLYE